MPYLARFRLPILLLFMASIGAAAYNTQRADGLPFTPRFEGDIVIVAPLEGVPLPTGLAVGDHIDLPATDSSARRTPSRRGAQRKPGA